MHRTMIALAGGAAAILGAVAPAGAITNEWVDDAVHDYVGLVVALDEDGEALRRCAGTLVGHTTVITAGHCTDGATTARVYFQADAAASVDPGAERDASTGYPDECAPGTLGVWCVESDDLYDFGFDHFASFPDTRDVGLIVLAAPPSAVTGRALLPGPDVLDPLSRGPERNRTVFTVSGYGSSRSEPPAPTEQHTRRMASSRLTNLRSSLNDGFNLQSNGNGRGFEGNCVGDGGDPVFLGDVESDTIVAVTSFGLDSWCRGTDFSYRIDRLEVLEWIGGGYLDTPQEPAG